MPRNKILNIPIDIVTPESVMVDIARLLSEKKQVFIATPNPEHIVLATKNKQFYDVLKNTDLNVPDGIGIVLVVRRLLKNKSDKSKINRVTGIDLLWQLCELAAKRHFCVGLLGGNGDVASAAVKNLKIRFPALDIVALSHYVYGEKDTEIIQKIQQSGVQFLFVALGAPKQELFISKYLQTMSKVRLAMGVGGAFDVIAGRLKRPPQWIQNLHFEWLYRLIQEPWRWRRQMRLIEFVFRVLLEPRS